ncbi:hypothetical protein HY988_03125 [Candidatus Micrarchaeota archaeon]|nr:hypothetical protein [Candidatus Micrarchaeota archaeon]
MRVNHGVKQRMGNTNRTFRMAILAISLFAGCERIGRHVPDLPEKPDLVMIPDLATSPDLTPCPKRDKINDLCYTELNWRKEVPAPFCSFPDLNIANFQGLMVADGYGANPFAIWEVEDAFGLLCHVNDRPNTVIDGRRIKDILGDTTDIVLVGTSNEQHVSRFELNEFYSETHYRIYQTMKGPKTILIITGVDENGAYNAAVELAKFLASLK